MNYLRLLLASAVIPFAGLLLPTAFKAAEPDPAAVHALVGGLVPIAERACDDVASNPRLTAHDIDSAVVDAMAEIDKSGKDLAKIDRQLEKLEDEVGEIDNIPLLRLHFLLGYLAGQSGNAAIQSRHRAFAVALTQVMEANGNGESPQSAIRPCLVANEYDWLHDRAHAGPPKSQGLTEIEGRSYDVITVVKDGQEKKYFFDVTAMMNRLQQSMLPTKTNVD